MTVELAHEVGVLPDAGRADEHLSMTSAHRARGAPRCRSSVGTVAPPEEALAFLGHDRLSRAPDSCRAGEIARRKTRPAPYSVAAGSVMPSRVQACAGTCRHLQQDAGAVAGVGLAAAGAPVQEVDEHVQRCRTIWSTFDPDVDDEADAARVVFVAGIVQTLSGRWSSSRGTIMDILHL